MQKSTYDRIVEALHGAREAISPWSYMSPTDVASNLPGGGIPQAWEASGRARDALYAGNYGQAAREYGNMAMNLVPEASPLLTLGGHLAAGLMSPTLYHGTHADFDKFKLGAASSGANAGAKGERAVFLTSNPEVADSYLGGSWVNMNSPNISVGDAAPMPNNPGVGRHYAEGANIRPVVVNDFDDFDVWDMGGGGYRPEFIKQAIKEARQGKAPGVIFQNMKDPGIMGLGSGKASDVVAVLNPKLIESAFTAKKSP